MHLRGYNYIANMPDKRNGLARIATLIAKARQDISNGLCVLLDNGDSLQGSALADTLRNTHNIQPIATSFNALGYDAIGLGNHDFDFGLDHLGRVAAQFQAPLVSTNLHNSGLDMVVPWAILPREMPCKDGQTRTLKIGILSVLPQQTLQWNHGHLPRSIRIAPMVETAKTESTRLKAMGADVVVLLAHSGLGNLQDSDTSENVALQLGAIDDIDAIIAGHTHDVFPNAEMPPMEGLDPNSGTLFGTPAAMPGFAGSHLAQIDLHLSHTGGHWHIKAHNCTATLAESVPEDEAIREISREMHDKTIGRMASTIGMIAAPLHSCFSMLKTSSELQLLADATARVISNAAVGTVFEKLPILSAVSPAASGGRAGPSNYLSIPAGTIQYRHILQLCPFEDEVWATEMSGAEVCDWLERSAAIFTKLDSEKSDQNMLLDGAPLFNFDVLFGLSYTIDASQPAKYLPNGNINLATANRVKDIMFKGKPLDKQARFLVATTSYRIAGGGRFPELSTQKTALRSGMTMQNALIDFVKDPHPRVHPPRSHWQIKTGRNCDALFETSPDAVKYLCELTDFSPEPLGLTGTGLLRLRLHF